MCCFLFIVTLVFTAEVIEPAFSTPSALPSKVTTKKEFVEERASEEAVGFRALERNPRFSNFPFRMPYLQKRMPSFYGYTSRINKQLQPLVNMNNGGKYPGTAQQRPLGGQIGSLNYLHRNNKNTLGFSRRPSSFPIPRTKHTDRALHWALTTLHKPLATNGKSKGNQDVNAGSVPGSSSLVNFNGNNIALMPQLKDDSANGEDVLVTSIVQIGTPLVIRPGVKSSSTKQHDKLEKQRTKYSDGNQASLPLRNINANNTLHARKPTNINLSAHLAGIPKPVQGQDRHISNKPLQTKLTFADNERDERASKDDLHSFLESIHNSKTAPQVQNEKDTSKGHTQGDPEKGLRFIKSTPDHLHFKNNTTAQHDLGDHAASWKQIPKDNRSLDRNHNAASKQFGVKQDKVMPTEFKKQNGESDHVERVTGYGIEEIKNHSQPFRAGTYANLLKQDSLSKKPTFTVSEHNNTTVISSQDNTGGEPEGFGRGHSNKETYEFFNYRYSQDPKEVSVTSEPSANLNDKHTDKIRYPGQDQDEYTEEYDVEDNAASPSSNQRYVPVDEFGSPLYGNETDNFFKQEALAAHNRYRAIHKAPPLKLDPQLSLEAERFAKNLAKLGGARHEITANLRKEGEGENVARGCSEWGGLTASGAVHRWYSQVCTFDWNKRTIQPSAKSFMQVIWKGTSQMGIGRALGTRMGFPCTFIVARYRPGDMNAFTAESNIDKGIFLPSYCNADADEGLMSTGYSSSFLADRRPTKIVRNFRDPVAPAATEITYEPMNSWERNTDGEDDQGLFREPELDAQTSNIFLPHLSYVGSQLDEDENMMVEDDAVKREYKPSKTEP